MAFSTSYQYRIIDRYTAPLKDIENATSRFRTVAAKTATVVKGMGSRLSRMEGTFASLAGVVGGAALINKFTSFEDKVNATAGVLNATDEQFQQLKNTAIDLGSTTRFTASEVGSAMLMLSKNSLNLAQTMGAVPSVLSLSAATGADLSLAADLATDVMANFGKTAADLPGIMDKLAGATVRSKFDIQKLVYAIANSSSEAKEQKVSFMDAVTALAGISSSFASGERAGTSFAIFLRRLNPKTKEQTKLMKRMGWMTARGTSIFLDATGKLKGLAEISDILANTLDKLTPAKRSQALERLFEAAGMKAASAMAAIGSKKFKELAASIKEIEAAKLAERRLRGLVGSVKLMHSALDALAIKIFEADLAGVLAKIANSITWVANAIGSASPWVKKLIGFMGGLTVALLPALMALKMLIVLFSPLKIILVGIGTLFAGVTAPVWGTVAAVTAAVAGVVLLIAKWESVWGWMKKIGGFLGGGFGAEVVGDVGVAAAGKAAEQSALVEKLSTEINANNTVNGEIKVTAPPGVVKSASMETSAPGDLGFNLAGS